MTQNELGGTAESLQAPAYTVADVARYVHMPATTLRSWIKGTSYPTGEGPKRSEAIIVPPSPGNSLLSFMNLVEAFVLNSIRKRYGVSLQKVRRALANLGYLEMDQPHSLARKEFQTDGVGLFVQYYGAYIEISRDLQVQMQEVLETYLQRLEYDNQGLSVRLYPVSRPGTDPLENAPRVIAISPFVAFGKPTIAGTGISTFVIVDRFLAGDSPQELAADYRRPITEIDEAIRWELACRDAA